MGILIKGMKMPKSCDECDLNYDCFRCILPIENSLLYGKDTANGRLPNCPLIELPPHGRLVDADKMQEEWYRLNFDRKISDGTLAYWNFQLSKMPTVIEAEEVKDG